LAAKSGNFPDLPRAVAAVTLVLARLAAQRY
jgi:hypothetical protein